MAIGLRGLPGLNTLSDRERQIFMLNNAEKLKAYARNPRLRDRAAEILYNNQAFINKFGQEEFDRLNDNSEESYNLRNQLLREKVVNDAVEEHYKPKMKNAQIIEDTGAGSAWEKIQQLSTDAKEKLLNSEWKTPGQMKKEQDDRDSWYEKAIDFVAGEAIQRYKQDSNQQILDRIYNDDADAMAKNEQLAPIISQAYLNQDITGHDDVDTKKKFVKAITPDYNNGNRGISAFASHYGNGSEDQITSEMEDFTVDDMRQILAKKAVYDQYLSPEMAATALNNEAMRYLKQHQGSLKRLRLFAKDVGISAMSYTADKINGINNLLLMAEDKVSGMPTVWVDENGEVVENSKIRPLANAKNDAKYGYKDEQGKIHTVHQQQIARTTLHNMGKNEDGSDEAEGVFHLNPKYWTRAEQFGTLDADEQKQYEQLGSSPYKVAYNPNDESDLVYESFKMMSFGIADAASMLIPFGVGAAGKAISTASKAGKVVQGFGKALNTTGRYLGAQTKVGSVAQGLAGAGGIAYAYQRGAFQETLAQNLAKAEETALNASKNDIYEQYNSDKEFKKNTDALIAARAAEMKEAYIAQNSREGNQVIDSPKLNQMLHDKAQEQVLGEMVQQRFAERKQSDEYAVLQQKAIDEAGDAATTTFIPEAIKYGLVNTIGFRKFWYSNPKQMAKQASKNFKGLGEVATETGKKRLAVTSRFSTMGDKAQRLGWVAAGQFWGGAWTNGTDDMMVDAAERINEDNFNKYLQAYQSGESIADVYGLADGLYSYWKGLQNSMGQRTTYQATAVGGFGGMVSATPNMANIASLATKEGRQAFKDTYKQRPVYETVDGIKTLKKDATGKPVMEDVNWKENWRERANFFIQNGVLNNYYANKASEQELQSHADYINELLDREDDFSVLTDLVTSDIALEEAVSKRDALSGRFVKALKTIEGLNLLANDSHDPAVLSSVVTNIKGLIDKAANGKLTQEEAADQINQYYAQHPEIVERNEATDQAAFEAITKNAQDLQKAFEVYDKAEKQVQSVEKNLGRRIALPVRESMKLAQAWTAHWEERLQSMRDEIGDVTTKDTETSQDNLIAALGSKKNASRAILTYALQEKQLEEDLMAAHKETEKAQEKVTEAQKSFDEAQDNDAKYQAQIALVNAQNEFENAQQEELFNKDLLDKTKDKKQRLINALEASKDEDKVKVLSADEIMGLDALTRAQIMNPENRSDYSEEQQREIKKLEDKLINKDGEALQKIQDIAILTKEIARNEDAYSRMAQHPEAAAVQLEKQVKAATEKAKELINNRNAKTLADFTREMDDALKPRLNVTQEQRENIAFSILKHYNPRLLDTIKDENLLPEFTQQVDEAKEWAQLASDVHEVINASNEDAAWKTSMNNNVRDIIEHSNTKKDLMRNLESAIDNTEDPISAQSFEKIMQGLESKGHLRDTLVTESRKQRQQREEAAKKLLEEEKRKEEAAKKAAEEAAAKEKVTAENTPKTGEIKLGDDISIEEEVERNSSGTVAEAQSTGQEALNILVGWAEGRISGEDAIKQLDGTDYVKHTKGNPALGTKDGVHLSNKVEWELGKYVTERYPFLSYGNVSVATGVSTFGGNMNLTVVKDANGNEYGTPSNFLRSLATNSNGKAAEVVKKGQAAMQQNPETSVINNVKKDEGKPLWGELVNGYMEEDAEAGSTDAGEVWNGNSKGVLTVSMNKPLGRATISFSVNGSPSTITVDGNAWEMSDNDTVGIPKKNLEAQGITKEMPFNVKTIQNINGKWYFHGNFAGHNTPHYLKVSDNFDLAQAIDRHRAIKEADAVASGKDTSNPNIVDGEDYVKASSPDITQQAEENHSVEDITEETNDAEEADKAGEQVIDSSINTLSGSAMPLYDNVALKDNGILRIKEGKDPKDSRSWYNKWMATFTDKNGVTGIKLDDIVSTELSKILAADPHTKIKFVCTPAGPKHINEDSRTAPAKDSYVGSHLFLVVDYDSAVEKIHKKENGGVIENEGNKYLIVGVAGYGDINSKDPVKASISEARRDNWFNNVFGAGANNRGLQNGRKAYFDSHPGERFRVLKGKDGTDVTTEIIPNSLIPGYIVKQLEKDDHIDSGRKLSELLNDKDRNPNNLKLGSLKWLIQEVLKALPINETVSNIMVPRNTLANVGRVFVLIPSGNGKFVPAHINPLKYAGMQEGKLKRRVDEQLRRLVVPGRDQYATRLAALNELLRIFYLKGDTTILLGKPGIDNISLVKEGDEKPFFTRHLDSNFKFDEFMKAFAEMDPRINITARVLGDEALLEEYDEAGALTTDCALLRTAGSSYAIYPVDANYKMVVPEVAASNKPSRDDTYVDEHRQTVMYNSERYYYDVDKKQFFSPKGSIITDDSLIESLEYNRQVVQGKLTPAKTTTVEDYYIISSGEHPVAITINRINRKVTKLSEQKAQELIDEKAQEEARKEREKNAQDLLKVDNKQEVDLGTEGDFIIDENTGEQVFIEKPAAAKVEEKVEEAQSEKKEKKVEAISQDVNNQKIEKSREDAEVPENRAATQNFRTLVKNKKYKLRIVQEIAQKWEDSPVQFKDGAMTKKASWDEIETFLKQKGANTEVIGTSDADIEAWIHTNITCK